MAKRQTNLDVLIVGAGAAGIGMAHVLQTIGVSRITVLERHEVGESFRRWPKEMRFITPSFASNAFGLPDLNAITMDTSPAFTLDTEHPSGEQYADYLQAIVDEYEIPVKTGVGVESIRSHVNGTTGFEVVTSAGARHAQFVIWAAGEFQYPQRTPFPGAEFCQHTSEVRSWSNLAGDEFVILGGYESGIDAASSLCALGKSVTVLDAGGRWGGTSSDPSESLSPYTFQRLQRARQTGRLTLVDKVRVTRVSRQEQQFAITGRKGRQNQRWTTSAPPLLATGFRGSLSLVEDLFAWDEQGRLQLSEQDESTRSPGLFVCGPMVRHDAILLCFIYKFRQRFAVVANAIGERLGLDVSVLEAYRSKQMYLDDLSCCLDECEC